VSSPSSATRSFVKYIPPAAGTGRLSQSGRRRAGRAGASAAPGATSAVTTGKLGMPGVALSPRAGGVDMGEDLPADQGVVREDMAPLQAEDPLEPADQGHADLGTRRPALPGRLRAWR